MSKYTESRLTARGMAHAISVGMKTNNAAAAFALLAIATDPAIDGPALSDKEWLVRKSLPESRAQDLCPVQKAVRTIAQN